MLTLYDYFRSSACYRVRIALNLKNLDFKTIPVHLVNNGGEQYSESYRHINPSCLVPTIQDETVTITQSLAIIEYLDEKYPEPNLLPSDLQKKALIRAFALSIAADTHPLNNLRVLKYLMNDLQVSEENKNKWYQHWMAKGLASLEAQLEKQTPSSSHFCFGNTPSLADVCLIPQLYNAKRFACDLSPYPRLVSIGQHCETLTQFQKAAPKEMIT